MAETANVFEDEKLAKAYQSGRYHPQTPNETLEKPVFLELLDDVRGKDILDLGCGDGLYGLDLLSGGCQSYLGLEAARPMAQAGVEHLAGKPGRVLHAKIEDWTYPPQQFDLVISRLALHYVADLDETFSNIYHTLRPGGQFLFSMVHPVITSCDRSRQDGGQRLDWIVDDYFNPGPRQVHFMGQLVLQYHRPLETIFRSLQAANFVIEHLRESYPQREYFEDVALYERRKRIPLFLFLSGRKR